MQGVREKGIILNKLRFSWSSNPIFTYYYRLRPWRFPISINDIYSDSLSHQELKEILLSQEMERFYNFSLGIIRKPDFGLKTWIADTEIHCVLYSYGFDNDDDSCKHVIDLDDDEPVLLGLPYRTLYVLSPVPLDGDILLNYCSCVYSVNDYRLDTTFVRQLRELQGDTLSPEEYQEWMEKREEFKRKEFGLE